MQSFPRPSQVLNVKQEAPSAHNSGLAGDIKNAWTLARDEVATLLRRLPAFMELVRSAPGDVVRLRLPHEAWKGLQQGILHWQFDKAGTLLPNVIGADGKVKHKRASNSLTARAALKH